LQFSDQDFVPHIDMNPADLPPPNPEPDWEPIPPEAVANTGDVWEEIPPELLIPPENVADSSAPAPAPPGPSTSGPLASAEPPPSTSASDPMGPNQQIYRVFLNHLNRIREAEARRQS
jgi:hypothetical protein